MRNVLATKDIKPRKKNFVSRHWVYKQIQRKRIPGLFLKIGGALFADFDLLSEIVESGRLS